MLASSTLPIEVLLSSDDGSRTFMSSHLRVAPDKEIVFKNNAGFPYNVVFDEDEIPSGVDTGAILMSKEDLLNGPGETYKMALKEKWSYSFYCSPHQGAGIVGKVIVN